MPRIIHIVQMIDCDSGGFKVRMNDGEVAFLPHDPGCVPCVGEELTRDQETGKWSSVAGGMPHMTVERPIPFDLDDPLARMFNRNMGYPGPLRGPYPASVEQLQDDLNREKNNLIDVKNTVDQLRENADAVEPRGSDSEGPQGQEPPAEAPVG